MTMPWNRARIAATFAVSALLVTPSRTHAQIRASELQSVSQTVDGTTIRLTYSRPRMRGRWPIFGTKAVQWGEVWTPGANWATLFETNRDLTVGSARVPKGKYGVWFVVRKDSAWTMLLDPKWKQFHEDHPTPNSTQIHVPLRVDSADVEDVLTFSFPSISANGGTLAMRWARTRVSADFTVTPTLSDLLPEKEAAPYVGTYGLRGPKDKADSGQMIVTYEGGGLKARFEPEDPYMKTFALMRVGANVFTAGLYEKGVIYEVLKPDMMFTFSMASGKPTTFEVRRDDDSLEFMGRRKP
jgi:hypothetical protein